MTGISLEASELRQHLAKSQIERIEMVYVETKRSWGEIPVVLVMDPRDSCAQTVCEGLRKWISEESVNKVLRDAAERRERPVIIQAIPLEVALDESFAYDGIRNFIADHHHEALCVVAIAEEGKTLCSFPLPDETRLDTSDL